jgi:hypothetical protein
MQTLLKYCLVIFVSVGCTGCFEHDLEESTLYYPTEPFSILELNSVFDVYLIQDTTFGLEMVGDASILENISIRIDSGTLSVTDESRGKWLQPERNKVKLYVRANQLYEIWSNASCSIQTVNPITSPVLRLIMGYRTKLVEIDLELDCGQFLYWNNHQCGGKVTLRGNTRELAAYTFSLMTFDASQLNTDYAWIENNSKSDCQVFVNDRIEYSIRGIGNIYLKGDPEEVILHEQTSSGTLIKVD